MGLRPMPINQGQSPQMPQTQAIGGGKSMQPPTPNQLFSRGMSPIGVASQAIRYQLPMLANQTRNIQPIQNGTGPMYARVLNQL